MWTKRIWTGYCRTARGSLFDNHILGRCRGSRRCHWGDESDHHIPDSQSWTLSHVRTPSTTKRCSPSRATGMWKDNAREGDCPRSRSQVYLFLSWFYILHFIILTFRFINLEVPALTDKWYGESQKLASAVFTLAMKLEPCIIFIDEIDTFLRSRDSHDHEATAMMKAQFMILWDGLISAKHCRVIVMGATNRPNDVDKAILRRLPAMFQINRPDQAKRKAIFNLILKKETLDDEVDINQVAQMTDGFSGSDLREVCRSAAMLRIRERGQLALSSNHFNGRSPSGSRYPTPILRPMTMDDFICAIKKLKESKARIATGYSTFGLD